jgi:hypothetical protein
MARQTKTALPADINQECNGKNSKDLCDFTKHETSRSRLWKCAELSCIYHTNDLPPQLPALHLPSQTREQLRAAHAESLWMDQRLPQEQPPDHSKTRQT